MTPAARLDAALAPRLAALRAQDLLRVRRVVEGPHGVHLRVDGRVLLNFCSNDYLGLACDPRVAAAARAALEAGGTGSGAAALVSGYNAEHRALEEELADFTGRERALLFSSGWAANLGTVRALLGREDRIVADELNHASLIDAGRLSGAQYRRVPHANVAGFEAALAGAHAGATLLLTDSVFSMDGDLAPLPPLAAAARHHGATLMVDDAHGFGVLGPAGEGAPAAAGLSAQDVPVYVATLGKSLGAAGAFVAGSATLIDWLVQRARTWVFSTAPPPALAAAARRALQILREEPERRARLHDTVRRFRAGAAQAGIPLRDSATPIQPVLLGDPARALAVSDALARRGFWVAAIRPPTVPAGTARLRITLSAAHAPAQVDALVQALAESLRATPAA